MTITTVAERCRCIIETLKQVIVGKDEVLEQVMLGILANGHILIEDYPGLAKTLIAHLCAQALDLTFKRIQFTPDILPSDITGSFLYNQREGTFTFGSSQASGGPISRPSWISSWRRMWSSRT